LGPDQLFAVILRRHQLFNNVDETPEGVFLVHEEQSNGGDPVETL
jgi:hypothetical protein